MGWGAGSNEMARRIARRLKECGDCVYCKPLPQKPGDLLKRNDCQRQPLQVFFTNQPRICRYFDEK